MKLMEALDAAFLVFVFAILPLAVVAQPADGVIRGRVITESGQPIPHAIVSIFGIGSNETQTTFATETVTDEDGNFVTDGLKAIPFLVSAWAPGYAPASDGAVLNPFELSEPNFVKVGEMVTIKLIRGGVITGRVTNDAGESVIGVPVKATRVRDENERSISVDVGYAHLWTRTTDDRGVYRIYGLAPGSYIVAAGGRNASSDRATPFVGRTTTYYPSATRDAATLVNVASGLEATGIDIRYRGEDGFAISGKIYGAPGTTAIMQSSSQVFLRSPATGETIDTTNSGSSNNQGGYAFYGVPNGEYELMARNDVMDGENGGVSTPRRVIVKGVDVTGIDLTLVANASVAGVVVIEKLQAEAPECRNQRKSNLDEIIVRARRDDPSKEPGLLLPGSLGYGVGIPSGKGVFTIRKLKPGRHRIEADLPDETWYLKTMVMAGSKPLIDPQDGLTVKSGDKLSGLRLTIAPGAAMLKGKITVPGNTKLPTRLHVHLIPAETEAIDDVMRFAETTVEADDAFSFSHLAPGKYFVLARAVPDSESSFKSLRPHAWGTTERKNLRKEAETANHLIELRPCEQITSYSLRLTR